MPVVIVERNNSQSSSVSEHLQEEQAIGLKNPVLDVEHKDLFSSQDGHNNMNPSTMKI